jgi:hypothetical protein
MFWASTTVNAFSPIEPAAELHQRIVDPPWPDSAFLTEGELFAQEEILGFERVFGSKASVRKRSKSANRLSETRQDSC